MTTTSATIERPAAQRRKSRALVVLGEDADLAGRAPPYRRYGATWLLMAAAVQIALNFEILPGEQHVFAESAAGSSLTVGAMACIGPKSKSIAKLVADGTA